MVRRLGNGLLRAAFAPHCAACGAPLASPIDGCVCSMCWATIEPSPDVPWPSSISAAAAGGDYAGSLRQIIHAFKYESRRSLAAPLADRMRQRGIEVLAGADAVVPVPLHAWRRVRRGFNQAADLASSLGLPVVPALWRVRVTTPQAGLTAAQRARNVHGAFRLSPLLRRSTGECLVRARVVVLVDDVRTTGATLGACAEALLESGVREVRVLTAAVRAVDHGERAIRAGD
jgi:ComF family protein